MRFKFLALLSLISSAASAGEAQFTDFTYHGRDAYYESTPLAEGECYNPVIPGWNSDPSIVRTGRDYWLVTSTFGYFPAVPLYHSTDLVNWEHVRNILDRPSQVPHLPGQSIDKGGIYAPQISFDSISGLYYMVTTDVGLKEGHFYVTASDPRGEWSDPTFLKGIDGIDPSFFFDTDGKAYIVYKEDTAGLPKWSPYRCIRFIEYDRNTGNTTGASWPLYESDTSDDERLDRAEGPHIYKVNGRYYLLTAEGGTGEFHSANIYTAANIRGPWLRSWRSPILTQRTLKPKRTNPVTCAGHADLVSTPSGEWWAVFLAQRPGPAGTTALGRETFLMPVRWSRDSIPFITHNVDSVPLHLTCASLEKDPLKASGGNYSRIDSFDSPQLSPEWFGLRGAIDSLYTTGGGRLCLKPSKERSTGKGAPAYLGRRIAHHAFAVSTNMNFKPQGRQRAGLLIFKNSASQFFLAYDGTHLSVLRIGRQGEETIARQPVDAKHMKGKGVGLKIESDGTNMQFHYQIPGSDSWQLLADNVDASHISCDRTGGFTGATVGLYAESL